MRSTVIANASVPSTGHATITATGTLIARKSVSHVGTLDARRTLRVVLLESLHDRFVRVRRDHVTPQ